MAVWTGYELKGSGVSCLGVDTRDSDKVKINTRRNGA